MTPTIETTTTDVVQAIEWVAIRAWIGLVLYVVIYDTWALARGRETLSGAFGRGLRNRRLRWLVAAVWGVTTLHLFGQIPVRYDPFHHYGSLLRRIRPR